MKRLLSVLIVLAMALTGFALAEAAKGGTTEPEAEVTIAEMMPVLDAVVKNADNYDAAKPESVWKIVGEVAENVKGENPTATEEEMFAYAQASFAGLEEMPELAGDTVVNTADMKGYEVKSEEDKLVAVAEHYSVDAEGNLYVLVGLYNEKNEQQTTAMVKLVANDAEGALFTTSVESVNAEMVDIEFTEEHDCHILFVMPGTEVAEATAEPTATPEPKELKKGVKGEKVKEMQKRLRKLGYLAMYADGDFGPRTEEAVKLFQQTAGLKVDGIAGYKTLKALNDKDAPKCPVYIALQKGDSGKRVVELQNALVSRGMLDAKKVTEKYDDDTVKAVQAFLASVSREGDGKKIDADTVRLIVELPVEPTVAPVTPAPTENPTEAPVSPAPTENPTETPVTPAPTGNPTEAPSVGETTEP